MIAVAVDLSRTTLPPRVAATGELAEERLASRCRIVVGKDGALLKNNIGPGVDVHVTENHVVVSLPKAWCM